LDSGIRAKVEEETQRIDALFDKTAPLLALSRIRELDYVEISAAALFLHSWYNGIENMVVLILKGIDEKIPNDFQWHKKLFEQAFARTDKRGPLFSGVYKDRLAEYLSFRHFIRHSYGSEIDWARLKPLLDTAEELWTFFRNDLHEFITNN